MFLLLGFSLCAHSLRAEDVYLEPEAFIERSFEGEPEKKALWQKDDLKEEIQRIFGRKYPGLRIRYWREGNRTAWILEEIGKLKPITTGFLIEDGVMLEMQVLIYRESHGWEVRYPFFSDQFKGLTLEGDTDELSKHIDGISGATLSVNALSRLARLALYLDKEVRAQ
ncbi:FMN-binding protein [Cerasicoccus maritimus]|uniref:FMN-binding protein n=1 Tax=Cerasicoccus maritimus TaxID=490089 RepID=UPI002852A88E|nr:FMN-binding protein [Cerasicoccus maritimus]